MNIVHLHLVLNHLPVIGASLGVLLLAAALLRRSEELSRVSLVLFVLLGVASVVVYLTGEPAEEAVEKLAGFSKSILERHEDAALLATIAMGGVGVLALLALFAFRRRPIPRWATGTGLVLALSVATLMGYTANLGGQIRHTEIRAADTTESPAFGFGERGDH
jgi:uncharacterized membrane protein